MFQPGIYFGLDADAYHADPALGSTDVKRLLVSAPDYWWHSRLNPARPEDNGDTPSMIFGRAVHPMVLEGREKFAGLYMREPSGEGLIVSDEDASRWIAENTSRIPEDVKTLPKSKAGKIALIHQIDPGVPILDAIKRNAAEAGLTILKGDDYDRIVVASQMISRNPELARAFDGGISEVSIFWEQPVPEAGTVIRCKARLDYLKVRAIGDLKSIRNVSGVPFPSACRRNIANYRYDVQAAHYMRARSTLPGHVAAGAVFGDHDPEWLARVAAATEYAFAFVFFQSTDAPITWACSLSPGNPILEFGELDADRALLTYARFLERYGADAAWILADPIAELDLSEMPGWFGRS
jgi:hypothetical protein